MPDKRQPDGQGIESETATTLIARRNAIRQNFCRGTGGNSPAAFDSTALSPENAEWLNDADVSMDAVVTMERLRQRHWNTYKSLMAFADGYTGLRVLHGLVEYRQGIGYDRLTNEYADCPRRTVRHKVKTLADLNVVERNGNPTSVVFVDEEREFLAVDAAATKF